MRQKGFTLIEVIIVVGIVAFLTVTTLANFPALRNTLALKRGADSVLVALRRAQQYSIGVRRFEASTGQQGSCDEAFESEFPAYGAAFSTRSGENQHFSIFADPDCTRQAGDFANDEIEKILLEQGLRVVDICIDVDDTPSCGNYETLHIWYIRPIPKIIFTLDGTPQPTVYSTKIILESVDGKQRSVIVRSTGQITIKDE